MRNIRKKQEGITLIALVITIIVLLILAGVSISMLSGENGILRQSAHAKKNTERALEEEKVGLAAIDSMTNVDARVKYSELIKELNSQMGEGNYTINPEDESAERWEVISTKSGSHYAILNSGEVKNLAWWYTDDGKQITNGSQTLTLGDIVDYSPAKDENGNEVTANYKSPRTRNGYLDQEYVATSYTGKWRVLGVDEDGNVTIMAIENVTTTSNADGYYYLGYNSSIDKTSEAETASAKNSYQYAESELDTISAVYAHGKGAISGRSIDVDDINKITGYNPNNIKAYDPQQLGTGTKYGKGKTYEYGNEITYSWTSTVNRIHSFMKNTGETITNSVSGYNINGFNWYNEETKTWEKSIQDVKKPKEIITLKCSDYNYDVGTGTIYANFCKNKKNQNVYDLLFNDVDLDQYYWLSSSCVWTDCGNARFNIRRVGYHADIFGEGRVTVESSDLMATHGGIYTVYAGIRPVISLKSDVIFGGDATNGWTI